MLSPWTAKKNTVGIHGVFPGIDPLDAFANQRSLLDGPLLLLGKLDSPRNHWEGECPCSSIGKATGSAP